MNRIFKTSLLFLLFAFASLCPAQETLWETYFQQGMNFFMRGNYSEAERLFRACISEAADLKDAGRMLKTLNALGNTLQQEGKYADEERVTREYLQLFEMLKGKDDSDYTIGLNNLGLALAEQGKLKEAEETHRLALSIREKNEGPDHPDVAYSLINLGKVYYDEGKTSEAAALFNRAVSIFFKIPAENQTPENMLAAAGADYNLALIYRDSKNYSESEKYLLLVLLIKGKLEGQNHPDLIDPLQTYAAVLRLMKRPSEATKVEARIRAIKAANR